MRPKPFIIRRALLALLLACVLPLAGPRAGHAWEFRQWGLAVSSGQDLEIDGRELNNAMLIGHVAGALWENPTARLDLRVELSAGWFWDYDSAWEAAVAGAARFYFKCCPRPNILPFVEAGIGPSYNTLDIRELGLGFNFLSFGGLGVRIKTQAGPAWEIGYRVRHISNAGLHHHNFGASAHQFIIGLAWDF